MRVMLIRKQMRFLEPIGLIFLTILVSAMTMMSSEEDKPVKEELLLDVSIKPVIQKEGKHLAAPLWTCFEQDLSSLKEAISELSLCSAEKTPKTANCNDPDTQSTAKDNAGKLIDSMNPRLRLTLSDCFRRNSHIFNVLEEQNGFKLLIAEYLECLCSWPDAPRRSLGDKMPPSPAPRPRRVHPPSPPSPKNSSASAKNHNPKHKTSGNSKKGTNARAKKEEKHRKSIIVAVVSTAVVTFLLAGMFFLCCTRVFRKDFGSERNDKSPLLSLSISDYSVGSSNAGSVNHEKRSSFDGSFINDLDRPRVPVKETLLTETPACEPGSKAIPPLKPPPGRVSSNTPACVEPLAPEPPLKLPPEKTAPPPPPPPAPKPNAGPPRPPPPAPPGTRPPPPSPGFKGPRPPSLPAVGARIKPPAGSKNVTDDDGSKTKLKPFFWDKVQNNADQSMVWDEIRAGSFQFNEEMIESLFGYTPAEKNKNQRNKESSSPDQPQFVQILDQKKAQNLSILLRALNVTQEEVCDALKEGNELPAELIQTLLRMPPTADEELKLRLFSEDPSQLGPAERFLKALVDIPFAYKRLESLLLMCTLNEEMTTTKESFETLEVACKELRSSRLFLKLLEAVLKTGNRMNDGTFRGGAQAFKLDTLLKLSDVKGTDGKTTLLHFVVQEIIRSEGVRAARAARESRSFSSFKSQDLIVDETSEDTEEDYRNLGLKKVSGLSSELENVKRAANIDAHSLMGTVAKMGQSLLKAREFMNSEMESSGEECAFHKALKGFVRDADGGVEELLEEEKRIMAMVKSTGDYFHGKAGKDEEGLRLFEIVRDFLVMLDKACRDVGDEARKKSEKTKRQTSTASSSSSAQSHESSFKDPRRRLFPAIAERRVNSSSSSSSDSDSS